MNSGRGRQVVSNGHRTKKYLIWWHAKSSISKIGDLWLMLAPIFQYIIIKNSFARISISTRWPHLEFTFIFILHMLPEIAPLPKLLVQLTPKFFITCANATAFKEWIMYMDCTWIVCLYYLHVACIHKLIKLTTCLVLCLPISTWYYYCLYHANGIGIVFVCSSLMDFWDTTDLHCAPRSTRFLEVGVTLT